MQNITLEKLIEMKHEAAHLGKLAVWQMSMDILQRVQDLLRSKSSDFRQAFMAELTDEFCISCGNREPCFCGRDD